MAVSMSEGSSGKCFTRSQIDTNVAANHAALPTQGPRAASRFQAANLQQVSSYFKPRSTEICHAS